MSTLISPSNVISSIMSTIGLVAGLVSLDSGNKWRYPLVIISIIFFLGVAAWLAWSIYLGPLLQKRMFGSASILGIDNIYTTGISDERQIEMMSSASGEISIMAISSYALIFRRKPELIAALARGVNVYVLIAQASSHFVMDIERLESSERAGKISEEILSVEKLLSEYHLAAKQMTDRTVGRLELAHYSTELRSSLILCGHDCGWLTLNLPPARAIHSCTLELRATSDGLLTVAREHCNRVWNLAKEDGRIVSPGTTAA